MLRRNSRRSTEHACLESNYSIALDQSNFRHSIRIHGSMLATLICKSSKAQDSAFNPSLRTSMKSPPLLVKILGPQRILTRAGCQTVRLPPRLRSKPNIFPTTRPMHRQPPTRNLIDPPNKSLQLRHLITRPISHRPHRTALPFALDGKRRLSAPHRVLRFPESKPIVSQTSRMLP